MPRRSPRAGRASVAGTSILPSLFTTGNLFLGFWAIVKSFDGQYAEAAPLIFGAIVLDMLDGRIARLTGTTSEFGAELDSLADAISFGVAPALMAYRWALDEVPRLGWLAAFLFAMCGVLRLARFNVQKHVTDPRFFVGLPVPAAAGQLVAVVAFAPARVTGWIHGLFALVLVVVLAFLMVSTFRYRSFKGIDLHATAELPRRARDRPPLRLHRRALQYSLLALASLYTLSGPGSYLFGLLFRRREVPAPGGRARGRSGLSPGATHPVVGVGGVLVHEGRVLLIRRGKEPLKGRWVVPGGTVELGETLEAALVREMEEETGLMVQARRALDRLRSHRARGTGDVAYHYVIADYLCEYVSGTPRAGSDALEVALADPAELEAFDLPEKALEVVRGRLARAPNGHAE